MKKALLVLICVALVVCLFSLPVMAEDDIKVYVNGEKLEFDVAPVLMNDRTLVPMRKIFETLGATVSWNNDTETASGVKDGKRVSVSIDNPKGIIDGKITEMDQPPVLLNDRTLVPLRFIAEAYGAKVEWDDPTQTVTITADIKEKADGIYIAPGDYRELGTWTLNKEGYLFGTHGSADGAAGSVPGGSPAVFDVNVDQDGTYKVYTLARDYAANQPGTRYYNVGVDGVMVEQKMGTHGQDGFFWQEVGTYNFTAGKHTLEVYDTSGFYARCLGLFVTQNMDLVPPTDVKELTELYGASKKPTDDVTDHQYPYYATAPMQETETISIENDTFKVDFIKGTSTKGALVQTEMFVKKDGQWIEFKDKAEEFGYLMMAADKSEKTFPRAEGATIDHHEAGESVTQSITTSEGIAKITTTDYFEAGEGYWFIPTDAVKTADNQVTITFPNKDRVNLVVTVSFDDVTKEPKFTLNATINQDGTYSFIMFSGNSVEESKIERSVVPFMFTRTDVPEQKAFWSEPFLFTPMVAFTTKENYGTLTHGLVVDPSSTHQDIPYWENARYGFMVRDDFGKPKAQLMAPLFGNEDSDFKAGDTYTFSYRVLAGLDGWYDTFKHVSEDIYNVSDIRTNYYGTLNDAIYNMQDLVKDDEHGMWDNDNMGFYYAEYDHTTSQCNVLELVQRYLMSGDEELLDKRVAPSVAFMLSRKHNHFNYDLTDTTILGSNELTTTPAIGGSALYVGLYEMSGGRMPYALQTAVTKNTMGSTLAGITSQGGFYEITQDESFLNQMKQNADTILSKLSDQTYNKGINTDAFVLSDYNSYIPPLVYAYELTGDKKYLEGAEQFAQGLMTALSSLGYQNGFDNNTYHVDPEATANAHVINADNIQWWWHGDVQWRRGFEKNTWQPEAGQPTKVHTDDAQGWVFAPVGLTTEHTFTAGHSNFILMNTWAPWLLKLAEYTGDEYFATQARNAVIGRFTSYPGYYIERYWTNYMKENYPYEGPEYNIFYWTHVAPFMAMVEDFQIQEVIAKSGGKVDFPAIYFDGYSYFTSNQYGAQAGKMYDTDGMWLWNDRGVVSASDININYVAARKDGVFGVALVNESSSAVTTNVTLGEKMPANFNGTATIYDADGNKTEATVTNGVFSVNIPEKGIVTAIMNIEGVKKPAYAVDDIKYSTETEKTFSEHTNGKGYVIQFNPNKYHAYVYVTDKNINSLTVSYEANGIKNTVTDTKYPFEALVKVDSATAEFNYTLTATMADGTTKDYGKGTLAPMSNGPVTDNIKDSIKNPGSADEVDEKDLPEKYKDGTYKIEGIGASEDQLRIVIKNNVFGFEPDENALVGLYVKGNLTKKADGSSVPFAGKILSNKVHIAGVQFVMQTDIQLADSVDKYSFTDVAISKKAVSVPPTQGTTDGEKTELPEKYKDGKYKVEGIGAVDDKLRIVIKYNVFGFTPNENILTGLNVKGYLTKKADGSSVPFTGKVLSNKEHVAGVQFVMQTDVSVADEISGYILGEVQISKSAFAADAGTTDEKEDTPKDNGLPKDYKGGTVKLLGIGEIGGKLRLVMSYKDLGFKPAENAFTGLKVKGEYIDAQGKKTAFEGKIVTNDVRDDRTVSQTDINIPSVGIINDYKVTQVEIFK